MEKFTATYRCVRHKSKTEFQTELIQPRLIARRGHLAPGSQIRASTWSAEARRIGQVEYLGAEIEALGFGYFEALDERHIQLDQPIAAQDVAARVAVGELRRDDERVRLGGKQGAASCIRSCKVPAA